MEEKNLARHAPSRSKSARALAWSVETICGKSIRVRHSSSSSESSDSEAEVKPSSSSSAAVAPWSAAASAFSSAPPRLSFLFRSLLFRLRSSLRLSLRSCSRCVGLPTIRLNSFRSQCTSPRAASDSARPTADAYAAAGSRSPWPLETELRSAPGTSSISTACLLTA